MRKTYNPLLIIIFFICCWTTASAGQYVQVSPDLEIYYEEAGTGRPLIFVTGWTGTNEFFTQDQFPYFSKKYRVLAYDPRGQGRSSKTLEGHTYIQHGKDLRAFLDALKLKDPVIVGWSNGCTEVYGYFRTYGVDGIKAFVCIDESPKQLRGQKDEWGAFANGNEVGGFINGTAYDRTALMKGFLPTMQHYTSFFLSICCCSSPRWCFARRVSRCCRWLQDSPFAQRRSWRRPWSGLPTQLRCRHWQ